MLSYQDFLAAKDKEGFILQAIDGYRDSENYRKALEAEAYYAGENTALAELRTELSLEGRRIDLTAAIRTPSGIFKRLITQLVQSIWAYGLQTDSAETKQKLGRSFDKIAEGISRKAALHGVCYGFWNYDHLERFDALQFFTLKDEYTGKDRAGVKFWQLDAQKAFNAQLYEEDGWSWYIRENKKLVLREEKKGYIRSLRKDALGERVLAEENYGTLPIIPMYANEEQRSELTRPIKTKIDLSDFILSGFCDSVLRTKAVYWVLQGFSGQAEELRGILGEIQKLGILAPGDHSQAFAQTVELPYGAVEFALDTLRREIYRDFMGMDITEITGGKLTNVAIETAQFNLTQKVSDFEWQAYFFVEKLLALLGIETENIRFKRKSINNDSELARQLSMLAPYLDRRTILEKAPMVEPDEVDCILQREGGEEGA